MMARLLAVALLAGAIFAAHAEAQTPARAPVVVELYTSQGCWQCVRANRLMGTLAHEDGVLPLTFAVDYWDYLGWRDTFAQPEFVSRQRAFATSLHGRRSTPQLVIDGARMLGASDWDAARGALSEVQTAPRAIAPALNIVRLRGGGVRVIIGAGPATSADVWMLAFDPGPVTVAVTAGENARRVVRHYNLVTSMRRLGAWSGQAAYFEQPRCSPQCAVLVQAPHGGPILAAAYTQRQR